MTLTPGAYWATVTPNSALNRTPPASFVCGRRFSVAVPSRRSSGGAPVSSALGSKGMTPLRFVAISVGVAIWITTSCLTHAEAPAGETSWTTFRNSTLGYSFRYPSDLEVNRPPVANFGIEGLVDVVDLRSVRGRQNVFRVLVVEARGNPRVTVYDPPFLRKVCKTHEEFRIDGRLAINCVTCGRASCAWTVYVPGSREFHMLSGLTSEREEPRPRDGQFPIRSIIDSFRWHAPEGAP